MTLTMQQEMIAAEWKLTHGPNRERALRHIMRAFGVGVTRCTRCAGTGKHGPANVCGGTCFNCSGWGVFFAVEENVSALKALTPTVLKLKELTDSGLSWREAFATLSATEESA